MDVQNLWLALVEFQWRKFMGSIYGVRSCLTAVGMATVVYEVVSTGQNLTFVGMQWNPMHAIYVPGVGMHAPVHTSSGLVSDTCHLRCRFPWIESLLNLQCMYTYTHVIRMQIIMLQLLTLNLQCTVFRYYNIIHIYTYIHMYAYL